MLLFDAAHHHAEMARLDDYSYALGFDDFLDGLGDLCGEALLNLQTAREHFDQARDFAQADDPAVRDVGDVHLAEKRQHVMLAEAEHLDVLNDDHLVVADGEQSALELAFRYGFGKSRHLGKQEVLAHIPNLEQAGLRGGVLYYDGQFDDARLLINLAQTATEQGAVLVNYAPVVALTHDAEGLIDGFEFTDLESGQRRTLRAHCIINATGAFSDALRKLDDPERTAR